MNNLMFKYIAVLLLMIVPAASFAGETLSGYDVVQRCWNMPPDKGGAVSSAEGGTPSHADRLTCESKFLEEKESERAQLYENLRAILKKADANPDEGAYLAGHLEEQLAKSQKSFESYMEEYCRLRTMQYSGTAAADTEIECKIDFIQQRIVDISRSGF